MQAAGWVAVNRLGQPRDDGSGRDFPDTLIAVLDETSQFASRDTDPAQVVEGTDPANPDRLLWEAALGDASSVLARQGVDPVDGAKYFGNNIPGYNVGALMENCQQTVPSFWFKQIVDPERGKTTMYVSNKPYNDCPISTPTP
jgi:hypothetical protein